MRHSLIESPLVWERVGKQRRHGVNKGKKWIWRSRGQVDNSRKGADLGEREVELGDVGEKAGELCANFVRLAEIRFEWVVDRNMRGDTESSGGIEPQAEIPYQSLSFSDREDKGGFECR